MTTRFCPSNNHDKEWLVQQALAQAAVIHVTSHGEVPMDEARRIAERDQIVAMNLAGHNGIACTEAYLFGEMAVPGDDSIPPGPWIPKTWTDALRRFGRALIKFLSARRAPDFPRVRVSR